MEQMRTRGARTWTLLGLAALLGMLLTALSLTAGGTKAHAATATSVYDWQIYDHGWYNPIHTGVTRYALFNRTNASYLRYGSRSYGINLVWSQSPDPGNIRFDSLSGGDLRSGDFMAVRVDGGGYLKYGERSFGINLVWSATPVYEWRVFGEGRANGALLTSSSGRVGLYNTRTGAYLVYGTRSWGINLVWKS
jgi:hypothetical protein